MSIFSNIKDSVLETTETFKEVMGGALKGACNVIMDGTKGGSSGSVSSAKASKTSKDSVEAFENGDAEHLYSLNITHLLGSEYRWYIEDVMRMVTIQVVIQLMMYLQSPSTNKLFDVNFIQIILYVVLGVTAYWLLVRKCLKVV